MNQNDTGNAPRERKDCRDCVHYYAAITYDTAYGYEYDPADCGEVPRMSNLKSFPFKNTTCKAWIDHERYDEPGPEGLSPRDIHTIQRRLGIKK